jgi:hypothetical protein
MKRGLIAGAVALAWILTAVPAHAKGVTMVTVSGPGLPQPLRIGGRADSPGSTLAASVANESGVLSQAISDSSLPVDANPPDGDLGPRYRAAYTFVTDAAVVIRQDVYPFATPGPVTFASPGQQWSGGKVSRGGWFRAEPQLTQLLVSAGLPRRSLVPHETTVSRRRESPVLAAAAFGVFLLTAGLVGAGVQRRRRFTALSH